MTEPVRFKWVPHWAGNQPALGALVEVDAKRSVRLLLRTEAGLEVFTVPAKGILALEVRFMGPRLMPDRARVEVHWSPGDEQLPALIARTVYRLSTEELPYLSAARGVRSALGAAPGVEPWAEVLLAELDKALEAGAEVMAADRVPGCEEGVVR